MIRLSERVKIVPDEPEEIDKPLPTLVRTKLHYWPPVQVATTLALIFDYGSVDDPLCEARKLFSPEEVSND